MAILDLQGLELAEQGSAQRRSRQSRRRRCGGGGGGGSRISLICK